jgi:hypothetical protein
MTQTTAQRCGIAQSQLQGNYYLENTYMDHRYNQRSRNIINIKIGQDPNDPNRDIFITTNDIIPIVQDGNFHYASQSLQDQRNRYFILIGMDTIQHNNLQIRADKLEILMPNPNYQQPIEKKFYKLKAMAYPDLSIQQNREFNIQNINS